MPGTQTAPAAPAIVNASADGFNSTEFDPESANVLNTVESMLGSNNVGTIPAAGVANVFAQSIPEWAATSALTATAGTVFAVSIPLTGGSVLNKLSLWIGTATSTPTNQWWGVASFATTSKVLAISADGTTTVDTTNSLLTLSAISGGYTVPASGLYYVFFCFAATTGPTVSASVTLGTTGRGAASFTNGPCATGKTTPLAVGSTFTQPTAFAAMPLIYLS